MAVMVVMAAYHHQMAGKDCNNQQQEYQAIFNAE